MCKITIIGIIALLTGVLSIGTLISGSVYCLKYYHKYDCGNLNYGLLAGLVSIGILIFNIVLCSVNCIKRVKLIIPIILVICSLIYNIYLFNKLSDYCLDDYYYLKHENLWDFYNYFIIALITIVSLIIIYGGHQVCSCSQSS